MSSPGSCTHLLPASPSLPPLPHLLCSFLKLCSSREELSHLPHGPKLVLATLPSLEAGFSRRVQLLLPLLLLLLPPPPGWAEDLAKLLLLPPPHNTPPQNQLRVCLPLLVRRNLFADWAEDPRNAVVFVTAAEEGTLGARVQALASGTQQPGQPPPTVTMLRAHRVPLEGQELEEHLAAQAAAAEATAAAQAAETAAAAAQQAVAAAEAAAAADGGLLSPRASRAVPRVNSVAIGHLRSGRGSGGAPGEVVAADGQPVEEQREAAATAACLVEGFEVPKVGRGLGCCSAPSCLHSAPVLCSREVPQLSVIRKSCCGPLFCSCCRALPLPCFPLRTSGNTQPGTSTEHPWIIPTLRWRPKVSAALCYPPPPPPPPRCAAPLWRVVPHRLRIIMACVRA